jgi:DNA-binding transcriptional MerR regulator/methylmalonyl-CoA mutase cobalamin-binding subunit
VSARRRDPSAAGRGVYKMRSIAGLSGFTPAVLRAWETRHGLLDPVRAPSGHRLYTEDDLRVLRRVRALLDAGRSIGEIALAGRESLLAEARAAVPRPGAPAAAAPPAPVAEETRARLAGAVVEAAADLDEARLEGALDEAFGLLAPESAIHEVVVPAAREIGERWAAGRIGVASEHLASARFAHRIHRLLDLSRGAAPGAPRAVCACFPDEEHQVGALIVAYHLGRAGHRVVYLGARLPFEDLERACDALDPAAVFLSVARAPLYAAHRPYLLDILRRRAARHRIVVGGAGAPGEDADVARAGGVIWPAARPVRELPAALAEPPRPRPPARAS